MKPFTYYRNAVTATFTEEELRVIHAALDISPAPIAATTQAELAATLKHMRRFRRRYERKEQRPTTLGTDRELFPAWVS